VSVPLYVVDLVGDGCVVELVGEVEGVRTETVKFAVVEMEDDCEGFAVWEIDKPGVPDVEID